MRTDPPLVSIITPVYNGAQYLEELIQSVRGQEYPRIEHLIIDDGSTDGGSTLAILKRNPHLRWWSRENRGQYATMNEGLQAAHGDIVCFVSADDLLVPGAVGRAAEFFRRCPECDVAIGRTQFITESGAPYADAPFQSAPVRAMPTCPRSPIAPCTPSATAFWIMTFGSIRACTLSATTIGFSGSLPAFPWAGSMRTWPRCASMRDRRPNSTATP